jgi:DNA-nicking Smr family endonuclease
MGDERRRRTRALTPAEAELWAEFTRELNALKRRRRAAARQASAPEPSQAELEAQIEQEHTQAGKQNATPPQMPAVSIAMPAPKRSINAPLAALDRRQIRMIASGRADIDARLDLHGMYQDEAYRALRIFLATSQVRGARIVLIITGKGKTNLPGAEDREIGVLRRLVPMWLREAELRQAVVAFGPSDARHGGAGALYVQLRKLR